MEYNNGVFHWENDEFVLQALRTVKFNRYICLLIYNKEYKN